ncbi:unnamed protein product [Rhizoctonia solani]|uniref:Uncharacterized protein n=1 Tax=Rhizoctonia solani TaxID=456999 RepID=A0A8H2WAT9_9AGAM|nr:unnamed protein product [Rhizoctonia solani]
MPQDSWYGALCGSHDRIVTPEYAAKAADGLAGPPPSMRAEVCVAWHPIHITLSGWLYPEMNSDNGALAFYTSRSQGHL